MALATAGDLVALFRQEVGDVAAPYLWSDVEVYAFADDAQTTFCERTDGISDATSAACSLAITANDASYLTLNPAILQIRSAVRADTGKPVGVINFEDLAAQNLYFDGSKGPVRALVIGEQEGKARAFPVPSETITVKLMVFRRPLTALAAPADALEIAVQYRQGLLHWMKRRAYGKQDAETYDQKAADRNDALFDQFCNESRDMQRRSRHKARTVAYGGI